MYTCKYVCMHHLWIYVCTSVLRKESICIYVDKHAGVYIYVYIYFEYVCRETCIIMYYMCMHICMCMHVCIICHSVHLEPPFPSLIMGTTRAFALAFCSEQLPMLRWPGTCAVFPAKSGHNVIGASYDDILMMWGFWMLTFTSHLHQGSGV